MATEEIKEETTEETADQTSAENDAWATMEALRASGEVLDLTVDGIVKGGVIVNVEGLRGFIPSSRLTLGKVDDLNDWLGRPVRARVITVDSTKNKLVLSAKEAQREERDNAKQQKIDAIKVGEVFDGTVDSIQDYGVFVDIGNGLSGLVHISQIALQRIDHPSDVLEVGQKVRVKVIGKQNGKLKLSIKALLEQERKARQKAERVELPEAENIGTSLGDILKDIKL